LVTGYEVTGYGFVVFYYYAPFANGKITRNS
jgi:hypothetical protein